MEFSVRADKLSKPGDKIDFKFTARLENDDDAIDHTTDIQLTVEELTEDNNPVTEYSWIHPSVEL